MVWNNILSSIFDLGKNIFFFLQILHKSNPLLNQYGIDEKEEQAEEQEEEQEEEEQEQETIKSNVNVPAVIYENKYLERYKTFPNRYVWDEEEVKKVKEELMAQREDKIWRMEDMIEENRIRGIIEAVEPNEDEDEEEEEEDEDYISKLHYEWQKEIFRPIEQVDAEITLEAREKVLNAKLDKYINNYITEYTPIGNVIMRYNHHKKTFEYFSNSSVPYRYLEPIGRRYVMTYWCKPLFIDLEEELKNAEKRLLVATTNNNTSILKEHNPLKAFSSKEMNIKAYAKNRNPSQMPLPPQIKANLPNVHTTEKQLLKENANRYTWAGRIVDFAPLKKVNKTMFDKKLQLSFSEFKRMQMINK
jgi:hypothetical protein